jgi:hypothetical protein
VIPTTIVAVLYFILFVVFTQFNSISSWLSEDSVDAGKCNTVRIMPSVGCESFVATHNQGENSFSQRENYLLMTRLWEPDCCRVIRVEE